MLNTFRSQMIFCITLSLAIIFLMTIFFAYFEVNKDVKKREEKSIQNISNLIEIIVNNEHLNLLEYKNDIIKGNKSLLKGLVKFTYSMHVNSSDPSYDHLHRKLSEWFNERQEDSIVEWMLIDMNGNINLSSVTSLEGMNASSFTEMNGEYIGSKISYESLSRSGSFCVFSSNEKSEKIKWNIGYFMPFNISGKNIVLAAFKDISVFIKNESLKKNRILTTIKENLSNVKIAESGFIVIFDGNKNILLHPPKDGYNDFCPPTSSKQCLEEMIKATMHEKEENCPKSEFNMPGSDKKFLTYTTRFKGLDWYMSIVLPKDEIIKPARDLAAKLLLTLSLLFLLCYGVAIYMASSAVRPLEILSRQMEKVPEHDFTASDHSDLLNRLPVQADNEIGQLAQTFRFMIGRLAENIQQLVEKTASSERIEGELKAAQKIQLGVLPKREDLAFELERKSLDTHALLVPARELGGDLYDFFFVDEDHLCFTIGDVAGKGIPAALFMLAAQKGISNAAHQKSESLSPAEIMSQINAFFCKDNPDCTFITLFIGILNVKTGALRYANGGHVPPIFARCQSSAYYKKDRSGPAVGVSPEAIYKDIAMALQPGEAVFLCTDGVTEAMNETEELFGSQRLLDGVSLVKSRPCKEVVDDILRAVRSYVGKAQQSDDIAMLMIRWGVENKDESSSSGADHDVVAQG